VLVMLPGEVTHAPSQFRDYRERECRPFFTMPYSR
jgi:hypothetical protein